MKARAYVALLRGINVGGNQPVKMDALRKAFESIGFDSVKTLLASGNVLFHATQSDKGCARQIREMLTAKFGLEIGVIVRSIGEMEKIVETNPFQKIRVTPETRLYVTFLSEKPPGKLKIPYQSPARDFSIVHVSEHEVFSVLTLSERTQSTDLMTFIDKEFGKDVTTRNWNTVLKIAKPKSKPA